MPSELAPEPAHPGVRVVVAPVVELGFCLFIVEKAARATNRGSWQQPWVEPFFESYPDLVERVRLETVGFTPKPRVVTGVTTRMALPGSGANCRCSQTLRG